MILQDLLKENLDVVFCGTAVSKTSKQKQSYYAGQGNKFYRILAKTKLTSKLLLPSQYIQLLEYNIGLTDLVKHRSGNDNVLDKNDFDRERLVKKIEKFQPKLLCFNGKAAASVFLYNRPSKTGDIKFGLMQGTIGLTKVFVAPSTSGSANGYWDESYWFMLKNEVNNG